MNLDESGGICERKTLFRMKKEVDQAGFKGTRTGPDSESKWTICDLEFKMIQPNKFKAPFA